MTSDSISVPWSVVIVIISALFSALIAIGSFCAHMLISMNNTLKELALSDVKTKADTAADLAMLKRHDEANREQIEIFKRHRSGQ